MKRVSGLIVLIFIGFLIGCSKDEGDELIFSMKFCFSDYNDLIQASFSSNLVDEVPIVKVNGIEMEQMQIGQNISGESDDIPYTENITFSITYKEKELIDNIAMPTVYDVRCNNKEIVSGDIKIFTIADNYIFEWKSNNCRETVLDYPGGKSGGYLIENGYFETGAIDEHLSGSLPDNYTWSVHMKGFNGSLGKPGEKPNITGEIGAGYVSAQLDCVFNLALKDE